jgi:endonuclease G, mitochondrial
MKTRFILTLLQAAIAVPLLTGAGCQSSVTKSQTPVRQQTQMASQAVNEKDLELPAGCPTGQFSKRTGYSICYNPNHKDAIWVAYELTREHLARPVTSRTDEFTPDSEFDSPGITDFSGTIYERGHLAPSADMKWSHQAQAESFSMANMTPQTHAMNHGRWKDLEEQVRNFAKKYGSVYIVTGPLLDDTLPKIPGTTVSIPRAHYKCVLEITQPKSICFIIPQVPDLALTEYVHSVDEVETLTHLDLFSNLDDATETKIEAAANLDDWTRGLSLKPFLNRSRPQKMNPMGEKMNRSRSSERVQTSGACIPKSCSQIQTCEEAKFLLNKCGFKKLDGDGDGIPCSKLCK